LELVLISNVLANKISEICAHRFVSTSVVGVFTFFSSMTEIGDKQKCRQKNTDGKTVKMIPNLFILITHGEAKH